MEVSLNETEERLAMFLARKRTEFDRANSANPTVYGDQTHDEMELNSIGAEIAFSKLFNTYPDMDFQHFGKDDAITWNGLRVDVKNTKYQTGKLMVKAIRRDKCDLYALMIGTFPVYRFAGFATPDELFKDANLDKSLPHPAYTIDQEGLTNA